MIFAVESWSLVRRLAILALPPSYPIEWIQALVPVRNVHIADRLASIIGVSITLIPLMSIGLFDDDPNRL